MLADANGDGLLDVWMDDVYFNWLGVITVHLYLNTGSGLDGGSTIHSGRGGGMVGDIDLDGDPDVLAWNDKLLVLRNDGNGGFSPDPGAVGPWTGPLIGGARLTDLDGDGDLDVPMVAYLDHRHGVYSSVILRNHARHLEVPPEARLGHNLSVELFSRPGRSLVLGISPREFRGTMGSWGDLRIDPGAMILLPVRPAGTTASLTWNFQVPNDPILSGLELRMQALDIGPQFSGEAHFTGLRRTRLVP